MSSTDRQPSSEAFELAGRLHSAAIHLLRRLRKEDDASGLSAPRLSALSVVVFGGPITITELAAAEQVRPATVSRMVKDLERIGLVLRKRDTRDERVARVVATEKGTRLLHEGRRRRVEKLASDLSRLEASESASLSRAVGLLENLTQTDQRRKISRGL